MQSLTKESSCIRHVGYELAEGVGGREGAGQSGFGKGVAITNLEVKQRNWHRPCFRGGEMSLTGVPSAAP